MKKYISGLLIVLGLAGCKFETLSNGDFDGYWHMMQVDTLSTGKTLDISEEKIFWAVEGKLLQLRYMGDKHYDFWGYYMRFSKSDTELVLSEPYINGWHEDSGENGGDTPLKDTVKLQRYGIYGVPENFKIEELTGRKMTLKSSKLRLYFNKQ